MEAYKYIYVNQHFIMGNNYISLVKLVHDELLIGILLHYHLHSTLNTKQLLS
jgi:hypothetical protein